MHESLLIGLKLPFDPNLVAEVVFSVFAAEVALLVLTLLLFDLFTIAFTKLE